MKPANTSKRLKNKTKLLALHGVDKIDHVTVGDLSRYFRAGDLLIVNRSATLPASFRGVHVRSGEPIEIRLAAFQGDDPSQLQSWSAFAFGAGDWRQPTENRGQPPRLRAGDRVTFGPDLSLEIKKVTMDRLLEIEFQSFRLAHALYRHGRPIQYSYLKEELKIWDQQTIFAGPPFSVEPPSASFALTWELVFALRTKGVRIAPLLHGAGISSTGSAGLDRLLPLTEWYKIPESTAELFARARSEGKQIVAVGTTVLRATESAFEGKSLRAGPGKTNLRIRPGDKLNTATAIITGMHDEGTSHLDILASFRAPELIQAGYAEAAALNYRGHEYGDIAFISA